MGVFYHEGREICKIKVCWLFGFEVRLLQRGQRGLAIEIAEGEFGHHSYADGDGGVGEVVFGVVEHGVGVFVVGLDAQEEEAAGDLFEVEGEVLAPQPGVGGPDERP
jgi:hypothetical protein